MQNCYFYFQENQNKEKTINVLCEKCHNEKYPNLGWFWEGSKLGYGPYDFICNKCEQIVYSPKLKAKNEN
jgi:formylmethanofuran dehydrogenase subunit E